MTNKEYLEEVLKTAVRKSGENGRSAQEIKRQLREIEQRLLGERKRKILQFQEDLRKGGRREKEE
jgi:hypothetical protein